MLQISLQTLIRTLVRQKYKFVIELSPGWCEKDVLMFVIARNYPNQPVLMCTKEDYETVAIDRVRHGGDIILHYDTARNCVIACAKPIYDTLMELKKKNEQKTPNISQAT